MSSINDSLDVLITVQATIWDAHGDEFVEEIEDERKRQTDTPSNPPISSRFDETPEPSMIENTSTSVVQKDISAELQAVGWRTIATVANSVSMEYIGSEDISIIFDAIYAQSDYERKFRDIVIGGDASSYSATIPAIPPMTVDEDGDKDSNPSQDREFTLAAGESER